ncbi:MAG: hypothetical protein SFZ02_00255 [bacterium]|nr:hypothetical protein [bacterium]
MIFHPTQSPPARFWSEAPRGIPHQLLVASMGVLLSFCRAILVLFTMQLLAILLMAIVAVNVPALDVSGGG